MPDTKNDIPLVHYRGYEIKAFATASGRFCAVLRGPDGSVENLNLYPKTAKGAIECSKDDIDRKLGGGESNRAMAELAGTYEDRDPERDRFDGRDSNDPQDR